MATSGEEAVTVELPTTCTADVLLFGFPVQCNHDGPTPVTFYSDGHAAWECPKCTTTHSSQGEDFE